MARQDTKNRIKELRNNSQLTQAQLAEYLEVDQSLITKIENGTRKLNLNTIDKICSLFGCSEDYLLCKSDKYIPIKFAFRANVINGEDLKSIATINKIVMNIEEMNELLGGE